ncbi:MAG: type 4a pilus biogenesis protein PilO [Candidatus Omnitrophica bacterium]|nr:type 4a pilus biogenesis protein PilO [Candidatus Omnitrophota bacterium]
MISTRDKTVKVGIKIAIGILIFIVLHIVARQIVFKPLDQARKRMEDAQDKLDVSEKLIREYPNPKKKSKEMIDKMEELKKKSVSGKELPRIIQQLTKKSSELSMEIISIRPLEEASFDERKLPQGVSKAYIEVVLKAPYKTLGDFLKALKELPIVFTIEGITIHKFEQMSNRDLVKDGDELAGKLVATLLISSYTVWH